MDFIPDIVEAQRLVKYKSFSRYSQAYISTNESLRTSMKLMPKNCNRTLVIAGSGDHPLFASLYGAENVDTFDISYNAKCIMDIKTVAIGRLKRSEYLDLLENLLLADDIRAIPNMKKVSKKLSPVEFKYLCSMNGYFVFNHSGGRGVKGNVFLPNDKEYNKLQEIVTQPYNFIMADLSELCGHLTDTYDFIHLSNVFDYIRDPGYQTMLLLDLLKYLNLDGRIVIQHLCVDPWTCAPVPMNTFASKQKVKNWKFFRINGDISVFERVR